MVHGKKVALVSHRSASKIAGAQTHLVDELRSWFGADRVLHVPVWVNLDGSLGREPTHRTRSFLFAALGAVAARLFDRDRISFFENGVVSLNLPPVAQVVGARATRTTHPQVLAGFHRVLVGVLGRPFHVDNPFAWMTKSEVVERISVNGCSDLRLGIDRPTLNRLVKARQRSTAKSSDMPSDLGEALAATDEASEGPPPYETRGGGIFWIKETTNGPVSIPLTNFLAVITSEIERDDGVEHNLHFEMQAELGGRRHKFEIPAAEFSGMSWVSRELGAKALLYPGFTLRDHARAAIQILSPPMPRRRVFSHTGWRKIDGNDYYLHSGGAIGSLGVRNDIETDLGELSGFTIAEPPVGDDLRVAITASLRFLDAAPAPVTIPLYAGIWRSVIEAADFALHIIGQTGVFKSELAALLQQHFGAELDARRLASWSSTGNALEAQAFTAKDALLVVDDFAPGGSQQDVARLQREAARLIRAQGNRSGRQRMRPDGSLRPVKPPRGLILSTGEDIPIGEFLISGETAVDRLPQQPGQHVLRVSATP